MAKMLVIQIKDSDGVHAFASDTARRYQLQSAALSKENFVSMVKEMKARGFSIIFYVQVFKDKEFARRFPAEAVRRGQGEVFTDRFGVFIDPKSKRYKEFFSELLVELSQFPPDAVPEEIMLDYIRFPEYTGLEYPISGQMPLEEKQAAVAHFVAHVRANLATNIRLSGALFPPPYSKSIGQDYALLCNEFDILSPMIYPSNDHRVQTGTGAVWAKYFEKMVAEVDQVVQSGCKAEMRPFLQGFAYQEGPNGSVAYDLLPDDLMQWQLAFAAKKQWKVLIYNSRSEYPNLWRVLKKTVGLH
jgi:hypothetical protein